MSQNHILISSVNGAGYFIVTSPFFAGILMIYAISGFMLNHKKDFNSDYLIRQNKFGLPSQSRRIPRK